MKIVDYIAVGAPMIVLILWSATRWFPDYLALAALITLILVGHHETVCAPQVLTL